MKKIILFFCLFLGIVSLQAQNEPTMTTPEPITTTDDLLNEATTAYKADSTQLLPDKYLLTQRLLWGQKGLMRHFDTFQLSAEERQMELRIRRTMLVTHQVLGFATLGGMVAQGIVGAKLYNGDKNLLPTHEFLAGAVNVGYFTTAALAFFTPPKMLNDNKGYSSIKLHKALAILHFSSMVATNILASQLESHPNLKPYHKAAAFTAFGSFAAAMIAIKF